MSTTSTPRPSWDVVVVPGSDGRSGYAYTVGLAPQQPELYLWAQPTDGDDVGADWSFTARELAGLLNDTVAALIAGKLTPDATWEVKFHGGDSIVTFRFAAAVRAPSLDTDALAFGTPVVPVRWQLTRGQLTRATIAIDPALSARIEHACLLLDHEQALLSGRDGDSRPARPTRNPDGLFGPWTPVVERVRSALGAHNAAAAALLVGTVGSAGHYRAAAATAAAAAERAGRIGNVHAAAEAAVRDARDWLTALHGDDHGERSRTRTLLQEHYESALTAAYATLTACDLLDTVDAAAGCGLVWAACCPQRETRRFFDTLTAARPGDLSTAVTAATDPSQREAHFTWLRIAHRYARGGVGAPLDPAVAAEATGTAVRTWEEHTRLVAAIDRLAPLPWPETTLDVFPPT